MAPRLAPLQLPTHEHEACGEPSTHVEAVQHVGGVGKVTPDRSAVGLGAVGDHHLHPCAPTTALSGEEARQGGLVAMGDHGQHRSRLAVLQHRHVAVAASHRGLVDQQDAAAPRASVGGHQRRPRRHQCHHRRPRQSVTAGHGAHGHDLGVGDHRPGQAPGEAPLELLVLLQVALAATVAGEASSLPHQRHRPARHGQVVDASGPDVVHPLAAEPAVRAARPRPGGADGHDQLVERVDDDAQHADQPQVQANLHSVGSHGASCSRCVRHTEFSEAPPLAGGSPTTCSSHGYAKGLKVATTVGRVHE